jgi:site-specific DNA-methyltransferase (adenine-specific)
MSRRALPRNTVLVGDVRERLGDLPSDSIDTIITSPPYMQLRNYGVKHQIGLEDHVDKWVNELRLVAAGLARVLRPGGSMWLCLGDRYSRHERTGAPPKSLHLAPERLALALIADEWILRSKVIWAKTNAMPASVTDRLTNNWEVVYLFVRSPRYHFDLDAIRVPHRSPTNRKRARTAARGYRPATVRPPSWAGLLAGNNSGLARLNAAGIPGHPAGKNPGDVWTMATSTFRGEHFATFPPQLVARPLLATCPERVCSRCAQPWSRPPQRSAKPRQLTATCDCRARSRPGVVLDPFFGSGTVGLVAQQHERDWIGIELNPAFAELAEQRIANARTTTTHPTSRKSTPRPRDEPGRTAPHDTERLRAAHHINLTERR